MKSVDEGVTKKRSFVRRHSSRARRSHHKEGPDSPRLDRHPSLRYSTTRLQASQSMSRGACGGASGGGGGGGGLFGRRAVASCSTLAVGHKNTSPNRKESSGSNASSSIGTCHDLLQPSTSSYSMSRNRRTLVTGGGAGTGGAGGGRVQLDSTGSSPETDCDGPAADSASRTGSGRQRRSAEDHQALLADRARRDVSNVNLLRLTPSDRDVSAGCRGGSGRGIRRNRSAEDFSRHSTASNRLSPASCRRQQPLTPEIGVPGGGGGIGGAGGSGSSFGVGNSSNHLYHYRLRDRSPSDNTLNAAGQGGRTGNSLESSSYESDRADITITGLSILVLLILYLPSVLADFISTAQNHRAHYTLINTLHVIGYMNAIVRPFLYQLLNQIIRFAVLQIACRR